MNLPAFSRIFPARMEETKDQQTSRKIISQWEAVGFVTELLVFVAVPTTLLALGGRWVDDRYGSSPWATVGGLLLSLAISALLVVKRSTEMAERMKSPPASPDNRPPTTETPS